MRIKSFKLFEKVTMGYLKGFNENLEDIDSICKKYGIINYTIVDGKVNVNGDVMLNSKKLGKIPINFGYISGDFYCYNNQLTSLEGSPDSVGGNFDCSYNQLTSLEGSPDSIGGSFNCNSNQLTSLEGSPDNIGGNFYCNDNIIHNIWILFNDFSKIELFNYMDPIRPSENGEEPIVYLVILNEFLKEIGKKTVTKINGYKCI